MGERIIIIDLGSGMNGGTPGGNMQGVGTDLPGPRLPVGPSLFPKNPTPINGPGGIWQFDTIRKNLWGK